MHGRHDDRFDRLLGKLREEYEELGRKGLVGETHERTRGAEGGDGRAAEMEVCGSGRGLELESQEDGQGNGAVFGTFWEEDDVGNDEAIALALAELMESEEGAV